MDRRLDARRVTPYPGVTHEDLVRELRQVHTDLINLRGMSHLIAKLVDNYLTWIDNSVRMLRYRLPPSDLDRLLLTRRYWAIQGNPGPGPVGVVETEIDDREAALSETINWIEATKRRWTSAPGVLVVADSSFYCQHDTKLRDVVLADILDLRDPPVRLIIPILVLDELEGLKQSSKRQTRWRAAHTLGLLDERLDDSGMGLLREEDFSPLQSGGIPRGRVYVEVYFDPPGHTRLPIDDEEIIDRALAIQAEAGRKVTFLTYDTAQATRARFAGLHVRKLRQDPGDEPVTE